MTIQDPFLYYLSYENIYINCSVQGEPPFEVSWLYSTNDSTVNLSFSDYTVITGSKVSHNVYNIDPDEIDVLWNSSLHLYPIDSLTVGYYYCRVNSSLGITYSKPYYVRSSRKLSFRNVCTGILCFQIHQG